MSEEYRRSQNNGIWLCQTCAKLIDSDESKFTAAVLHDWRQTSEHLAAADQEGRQPLPANAVSISFAVEDWAFWTERGTYSDRSIIVVSIWSKGDTAFGATIRLRNNSSESQLATKMQVELRKERQVLDSVRACMRKDEAELLPHRWLSKHIHYAFKGSESIKQADSAWFTVNIVGQGRQAWKIADI